MTKEECKNCKFWRDWGIPFIVVLIGMLIFVGYKYWDSNLGLQGCTTLLQDKNDELKVCSNPIEIRNADLDELFTNPNYNDFCREKGFETGRLTSLGCNGVGCISSKVENDVQITTADCFSVPEFLENRIEKRMKDE